MNLTDLSLMALVAIICGTVAQLTSGYSKGGWIVNLAASFFGALAGVVYDLKVNTVTFPLIYSIIGAVFFVAALSLIVKPGRR
jgi:uncharacterized membrane protein YeaQ/YmgE (transglycosylase-associated protein family)